MIIDDSNLRGLTDHVVTICRLASAAIMDIYDAKELPEVEFKGDLSPVTKADKAAHTIIVGELIKLSPDLPVLSEEQDAPSYRERKQWKKYWLVDPLDGTREFIDRNGEFTINVALIAEGRPVLGVVFVPLEDIAYCGAKDCGAWKVGPEGNVPLQVIGVPKEQVRVLISRRNHSRDLDECLNNLRLGFCEVDTIESGSALKFCRLAEGLGDIYPRFSPCCEWDTAAGQAVLEGAGGELLTVEYKRFSYNQRESLINPHFYAIGGRLSEWRSKLP